MTAHAGPEPTAATGQQPRAASPRLAWLLLGLSLIAIPVFSAHYVPAADLPQHLAQVRLMDEWFGLKPATVDLSELQLQPFAAHTLPYWPMWLLARLGSSALTGQLFVFAMLAASAACLHYLAGRRGRHPAAALGASCFLFSAPLYWGFLNFLCGLPCFLLFVERMLRDAQGVRNSRADRVWIGALCLGMYGTHVFWLVAAALFAPLALYLQRQPLRLCAQRLAAMLPAFAATALWYPGLVRARGQTPVDLGARYLVALPDRLSWEWLVACAFGGLRGPWEPIALAALLLAGALALGFARLRGAPPDRALLALGAGFLLFGLLAPEGYMNTILLNQRFMPIGALLVMLALPLTALRGLVSGVTLLATLFSVVTALVWTIFNEDELSGLDQALGSSTAPRSVLGVDLRRDSTLLRDRPFLQAFAYFQAEHGGELNFSFTEHHSSIVAQARPRVLRWTHGLEWYADRLTESDLQAFDCLLVNGTDAQHRAFAQRWGLPPSQGAAFRLYCTK